MIRVMLLDDHPVVLAGLRQLFAQVDDITIVGSYEEPGLLLAQVGSREVDVLVVDLRLRQASGLEVLRSLPRGSDAPRVLVLTGAHSDADAAEAIACGARGIILKEAAPDQLIEAVRTVFAGGTWFNEQLALGAMRFLLQRDKLGAITAREREIVRMVAQGHRNKSIGEALGISEGTVKIHLNNIYRKLGVDGRLALTVFARSHGLE